MPEVFVKGPKIEDVDAKRALVKEVTDALEKAYKLPRPTYVIHIGEFSPDNVGVGGELNIDRHKG